MIRALIYWLQMYSKSGVLVMSVLLNWYLILNAEINHIIHASKASIKKATYYSVSL
jgi:hypothetical protein